LASSCSEVSACSAGVGEGRAADEVAAVEQIALERAETAALIELRIRTALEHVGLAILQNRFVGFGSGDQPFDDLHGFAHVFAQSGDLDRTLVGPGVHVERAGDVVHLRCDLFGGHLVGPQIAQVVECQIQRRIVLRTGVEDVDQREDIVGLVLLVENVDAGLRLELRHVFLVIDEYGFDRLHLRGLYLGEEFALRVAVGHDRGDLRCCDLLLVGVFALAFVDDGVTFGTEVFVGPLHDVLLGDLRHAVEPCDLVGPVCAADERIDIEYRAAVVLLERAHQLHFVVVDGRFNQFFIEVPLPQFCHLLQKQVADFVERLPRLGASGHEERTVIGLRRGIAVGREHLLLLVQVEVDQSGLSVVEDRTHDVADVGRFVVRARQTPAQHDVGRFESVNLLHHGSRDRLFGFELQFGQVGIGLHVAEVLLDRGDHFVGFEIARNAYGHVVGHVVGLVVVSDVGDRRIFQMLLCSQHGLRAVGVVGEQRGVHRFPDFAAVLRQGHVLLLVNGLKLGMEAADHGILETVGLDFGPVVDLVRGNVLDVDRHVLRREGVGAVGSDGRHQLVVLVGNGDFRSFVADRVYAAVDGRALGLVGGLAVNLEETFDLVEHRFLRGVVRGAELLRAFEHQVFEVVRQTRGLRGVVLAADLHGDIGLDAGRLLVYAHVDFQSVVERVDAGVQRIARHRFVLVLGTSRGQHRCDDYRK